jgi:hypothetical protein
MSFNETANRDAKILAWEAAVKALAAAKDAEAALRKEVLAEAFAFDPEALREGTENFELGNGYKLKAVFKISRNLNNENEAVDKVLSKIEKTGPEGAFIAERLVKWKPELSVSEYKKLPEKFKKLFDEVVTSKEAMPSLELVAPKSK